MSEPICRCELCMALLELAASAERNLQERRATRKLRIVDGGTRRKRAA